MEKKSMSALTAALILLVLYIAYSCIVYFGKLMSNQTLPFLWYGIVIATLIYFIIKYGKDREDNVTFGNLFGYGFKITAIFTIFSILFTVILFSIFPEIKAQIFEIAEREALKNQTAADAEKIREGMDMFKKMFWVFTIGGILFLYAILGCIGSLIGAAVAKKNPRVYHDDSL